MGRAADDERLGRAEGGLVVGADRTSVGPALATGDTATRGAPHVVADPLQVLRAATGLSVMCVAWAATIPADLAYAGLLGLDGTRAILATRGVATIIFAGMWLRFRLHAAMSMRELRLHRHALVDVGMLALGLEASMLGGLGSDVAVGAIVIAASLGVFPRRWRDHLPMSIVAAAIYPLTVLGVALAGGPGAASLHDPLAVFRFALHTAMIAVAAALGVVMSHLGWSLRRGSFANKRVGRYELRRLLGRGGMGEVWAAHHAGLRREVALKMLDARIDDAIARERFEREIRATAELAHPHTVRVFDYGTTSDGVLFYAMELLEGEHLAALVRREGQLTPERAAYRVDQAARALGAAHDERIGHRAHAHGLGRRQRGHHRTGGGTWRSSLGRGRRLRARRRPVFRAHRCLPVRARSARGHAPRPRVRARRAPEPPREPARPARARGDRAAVPREGSSRALRERTRARAGPRRHGPARAPSARPVAHDAGLVASARDRGRRSRHRRGRPRPTHLRDATRRARFGLIPR